MSDSDSQAGPAGKAGQARAALPAMAEGVLPGLVAAAG